MKKYNAKRLVLNRQTIAQLTGDDLVRANAGMPPATATRCLDRDCTIGQTKTGCVTRTAECV